MPRFVSRVGAIGPAATAPLTIGTNTTTSTDGLYFGTDTPLYRSAANVLKCNQLDQVVPPLQVSLISADAGWYSIGATGQVNFFVASVTMPFTGSLTFDGYAQIANTPSGVAVSYVRILFGSSVVGYDGLYRAEGAPGAGQAIWTIPASGFANFSSGTVVAIQFQVQCPAGSNTIQVGRLSGYWIACRT